MDKKFAAGFMRFEGVGRDYTCPLCGWFRDVRKDEDRFQMIDHPQWGRVSWVGAAKRDVEAHDCNAYRNVIVRIRSLFLKDAS